MKESEFRVIVPAVEDTHAAIDKILESDILKSIRLAMAEASKKLPSTYSLEFNMSFSVFDDKRGKAFDLTKRGITVNEDAEPYEASGDSSIQRYMVEGEICQLPHEFCPKCWGQWMFKVQHPECPECGIVLGKDLKFMMDTDTCPNCEEGKVTRADPKCSKCGVKMDDAVVVWG